MEKIKTAGEFPLFVIDLYQKFLSLDQSVFSRGRRYCVFEPTCSEYTRQAISYGGFLYGIRKGILRIIHCHPFQKNYLDPFKP